MLPTLTELLDDRPRFGDGQVGIWPFSIDEYLLVHKLYSMCNSVAPYRFV